DAPAVLTRIKDVEEQFGDRERARTALFQRHQRLWIDLRHRERLVDLVTADVRFEESPLHALEPEQEPFPGVQPGARGVPLAADKWLRVPGSLVAIGAFSELRERQGIGVGVAVQLLQRAGQGTA